MIVSVLRRSIPGRRTSLSTAGRLLAFPRRRSTSWVGLALPGTAHLSEADGHRPTSRRSVRKVERAAAQQPDLARERTPKQNDERERKSAELATA